MDEEGYIDCTPLYIDAGCVQSQRTFKVEMSLSTFRNAVHVSAGHGTEVCTVAAQAAPLQWDMGYN